MHGIGIFKIPNGLGRQVQKYRRIITLTLYHKRDIETTDRLFDPGHPGNHRFNDPKTHIYRPKTVLVHLFSGPPATSGKRPPGNLSLSCCVSWCGVNPDVRSYVNQSESGEARVAGSNSGGGGNAPLALKCFSILSMTRMTAFVKTADIRVLPAKSQRMLAVDPKQLFDSSRSRTGRTAQYLLHRVFILLFQVQVTVFFVALQDSFAFQKPGHAVADLMHQFHQFLSIR